GQVEVGVAAVLDGRRDGEGAGVRVAEVDRPGRDPVQLGVGDAERAGRVGAAQVDGRAGGLLHHRDRVRAGVDAGVDRAAVEAVAGQGDVPFAGRGDLAAVEAHIDGKAVGARPGGAGDLDIPVLRRHRRGDPRRIATYEDAVVIRRAPGAAPGARHSDG